MVQSGSGATHLGATQSGQIQRVINTTIGATFMMPNRTTSLAFAAACLTAIVTMPAHAQTAGTYGSAPGYNRQQPLRPACGPIGVGAPKCNRESTVRSGP
jgi:hypothetical protein